MAARKGRHKYVYAPKGTDWEIERAEDRSKDSALKEIRKLSNAGSPPLPPEKVCPHGGVYFNEIPRCGLCFKQTGNGLSPEMEFHAFMLSLYDVCKNVAWKHNHHTFRAIHWEDKIHHAFSVVIEPKNLRAIQQAKNPLGMAFHIADYRMVDLKRTKYYWKEWPVSALNLPGEYSYGDGDNTELETDSQRLEFLARPKKKTGAIELSRQLERNEDIRYFPGVKLLWTEENIQKLIDLAQEGMYSLPDKPLPYAQIVEMRAGVARNMGTKPWTWEEIARFLSPGNSKPITVDQVRYAFGKAAYLVRMHILRSLVPALGKITDRSVLIPRGVKKRK